MSKFALLLKKEIRDIFSSKAALLFLFLQCFLAGYSFCSAVSLYSNASVAAVNNPLYATGFEPVPGVFVPTWGGLYLLYSLLLPFVVIPTVVMERARNTLVILLQVPFRLSEILLAKVAAGFLFLVFSLLLMLPAIYIWHMLGGHVPLGELLLLNAGYLLYGLFVIGVSVFAGTLFNNVAGASILSIVLITVSWIIEFGKDMNVSPMMLGLAGWTTTAMLKSFEHGVLSLSAVLYFVILSVVFVLASRSFFDVEFNIRWIVSSVVLLAAGLGLIGYTSFNVDVTESHRNSFQPAIVQALKKMPPLEIDVYLRRTDSRFRDYEASFLKKLFLVKRDIRLKFIRGRSLEKNYGLFVYRVNGKSASTYSNSEEEIFPLLFKLAGINNYRECSREHFRGYPLVVKESKLSFVRYAYYVVLPLMLVLGIVQRKFFSKRRLKL